MSKRTKIEPNPPGDEASSQPSRSAARLRGDDYQHLYSWYRVLGLLIPEEEIAEVRVEDRSAMSVDDVTIRRAEGAQKSDSYIQVKYHMDHRDAYSSDNLLHRNNQKRPSLLQKFHDSWRELRNGNRRSDFELVLFSNWRWTDTEKFTIYLKADGSLSPEFFTERANGQAETIREKWRTHLGLDERDCKAFLKTIRFKLGVGPDTDLWFGGLTDRMRLLGLKADETTQKVVVGIVREWIKKPVPVITREVLNAAIEKHRLRTCSDLSVRISVCTIAPDSSARKPDFELDWRKYFDGNADERSRSLKKQDDWNEMFLPELRKVKEEVKKRERVRLIKVSGKSRLPIWFAFGFQFSGPAGFEIEFETPNQKEWRTDEPPNANYRITPDNDMDPLIGELLDPEGESVAVAISVASSVWSEVQVWLAARREKITAALHLRPERGIGDRALGEAGEATAFAQQSKMLMKNFVDHQSLRIKRQIRRLFLFYGGPAVGACFLGHRLNAIAGEVVIMNHLNPGYAPSFRLT